MALKFTATSSQKVVAVSNTSMSTATAFSISLWFNLTTLSGGSFISKFYNSSYPLFYFGVNLVSGTNPKLHLGIYSNTTTVDGTTTIPLNTWNHAAWTYEPLSTWKNTLYLNGIQEAVLSYAHSSVKSAFQLGIAQPNIYLNGALEDVRIYTRALTPDEVLTISTCTGTDGIYDGMVHRYLLTEGATTGTGAVLDYAEGGIKATPSNSPVYSENFLKVSALN